MDYNKMIETHEDILNKLNEKISKLIDSNETGQLLNIQKFIREEINIIDNLSGLNKNDDKEKTDNTKKEDKLDYFNNFKNCMVLDNKELDDGVKILSCDIGIATGENEDYTYYHIGTYNKHNDRRKSFIIDKFKGNSKEIVDKIYNLFYDNQCDYLLFNIKGIGNVIYDMLTQKKLSIIDNEFLNVSSDECIKNLKERIINSDNKEVIIPFCTTSEINNNMYSSLNKNLKDYNLLLQNDENTDNIYELIKKSNLQITNGYLKFVEPRGENKEDFITLCMFNYFCDKLKDYYENENKKIIDEKDIEFKLLIGERCSGITTTLLAEAQLVGGTYVTNIKSDIERIKHRYKEFDYDKIKMITYEELQYNKQDKLFIDLKFIKKNVTMYKIKEELKKIGVINFHNVSIVGVGIETYLTDLFPYLDIDNEVILRENNKIGKIIGINLPNSLEDFYNNPITISILFKDNTKLAVTIVKIINHSLEECLEKHFKQIGNKKFKDTLN